MSGAQPYPRIIGSPIMDTPKGGPRLFFVVALGPQAFEVVCFCTPRRKDGSCQWSEAMQERLQPWYRSRSSIRHPARRAA